MNIIAFDSSDQVLSVALAVKNEVWYTEIDAGPRHSELVMESADGLCKGAGLGPEDLNIAACMKGPGSFTGLRIGFSAAKGMALALDIPLISVPTLDCMAYPFSIWPGLVIPAIDAKKACFFAAVYREGKQLTDYLDASPETIANEASKTGLLNEEPVLLTGPGAELLFAGLAAYFKPGQIRVDPGFRRGKAQELLEIVKGCIVKKGDDINSGPVYLRKSDAELNRG